MVLDDADVGVLLGAGDEGPLDFEAGGVGGVDDAAGGVASFAGEAELSVFLVEPGGRSSATREKVSSLKPIARLS